MDADDLWRRMDMSRADISPIPAGLHPIEELAWIRDAIFRERTGVNRDQKQKAASAEQTRRSCPAVIPADLDVEIAALDEEISAQTRAAHETHAQSKEVHNIAIVEINERTRTVESEQWRDFEAWAAKKRAEVEREISERKR
jgi:hypothetical protein